MTLLLPSLFHYIEKKSFSHDNDEGNSIMSRLRNLLKKLKIPSSVHLYNILYNGKIKMRTQHKHKKENILC